MEQSGPSEVSLYFSSTSCRQNSDDDDDSPPITPEFSSIVHCFAPELQSEVLHGNLGQTKIQYP